jgi:hypothetical protein
MQGLPIVVVLVLVIVLFFYSFRVLREYERGVIFQLGRFWSVKGPGLVIVWPVIQQMVKVSMRTVTMDVPSQDVISRDNVSVKVNAVLYFRVVDPQKCIIQVENYLVATSQLAQTTLRAVLGKHELDEMLAEREKLNLDIQRTLDSQTDAWGIKVLERGDQADRPERDHGARDCPPGGSRARTALEGDSRRGRAAGLAETARGGAHAFRAARSDAAALSADADRYRRRPEQHHRLPARPVARDGTAARSGVVIASNCVMRGWRATFAPIPTLTP